MATKAVLDAIKTRLVAANLVLDRAVMIHAGKFTWAELKRRGFSAPALFITCLGWKEATEAQAAEMTGYDLVVEARFAVGVVAKDAKSAEQRNAKARAIAEGVCAQLIRQDWGLDYALTAEKHRAEGLFVPAAEAENHSMWLVTWQQVVGLTAGALQNSIDDWLTAHGDHYDPNDPNHLMASDDIELPQ